MLVTKSVIQILIFSQNFFEGSRAAALMGKAPPPLLIDVTKVIKEECMRWTGLVLHAREMRNSCVILVSKRAMKRPLVTRSF
jgi:hypothetical protein